MSTGGQSVSCSAKSSAAAEAARTGTRCRESRRRRCRRCRRDRKTPAPRRARRGVGRPFDSARADRSRTWYRTGYCAEPSATILSSGEAAAAVTPRYFGSTTVTWWPSRSRASGSAPTTSARPPVLAQGATSDATIRIVKTGRASREPGSEVTLGSRSSLQRCTSSERSGLDRLTGSSNTSSSDRGWPPTRPCMRPTTQLNR